MSINGYIDELNIAKDTVLQKKIYPKGISIILPIHNGKKYLQKCLDSLSSQELIDVQFETIIIFNGKYKESLNWLYENYDKYSQLNMLILINETIGAGAARNLGLQYVRYSHVTFIDVDDYISANYLQTMYEFLEENTITITQLHDVKDNVINSENIINKEVLRANENSSSTYYNLKRILTITVSKAIPTEYFNINTFKEQLKSGEDTVLFTEILVTHQPKLNIIPIEKEVIYFRVIRDMSLSRQNDSFDFLVNQRIDILKILESLLVTTSNKELKQIILQKYDAQVLFINKYVKNNLNDREMVLDTLNQYNFKYIRYPLLNRDLANTLYISYCFAPYNDTSAVIVSKRILQDGEVVDVVSNDMTGKRTVDNIILDVVSPYIENFKSLSHPVSFSNYNILKKFIIESLKFYDENPEKYTKVYSRAMFPISHFPAFLIKKDKPLIYWKAEFSDPLLMDINSKKRFSNLDDPNFHKHLSYEILGEFTKFLDNNLFNIAELIVFSLADEIVFTNEHQLAYMTERFPSDLQESIRKKSTISEHPTLSKEYYNIIDSNYKLNTKKVNIAYFGNFYSKRGISEIVEIKHELEKKNIFTYSFHIFTNKMHLSNYDKKLLEENKIIINNYIPYFEFLNLSTKFDGLIVTDSKTKDLKSVNPYLPSKLSDYFGTDTEIIALVEENSIIDKMDRKNLHKITLDNMNFDRFIKNVLDKKEEFIYKNDNETLIKNKDYQLKIPNSMLVKDKSNKLLVQPNETPTSTDKNFSVNIINTSDVSINVFFESFYSKENIIGLKIYDDANVMIYSEDYSNLTNQDMITISEKSSILFKIEYKKERNGNSFLRAGRLGIRIKNE